VQIVGYINTNKDNLHGHKKWNEKHEIKQRMAGQCLELSATALPSQVLPNTKLINHPTVWCHKISVADNVVKYTTNNIIKQAKLNENTKFIMSNTAVGGDWV
jgi:hypothetical protein